MKQIKFRTLVEKGGGLNKIWLDGLLFHPEQPVMFDFKDIIGKATVELKEGGIFADIELDWNNEIVKKIIACSENKIPLYPAISMIKVVRDRTDQNMIITGELTSVSIQATPNEDKTIQPIKIICE